MGKYEKIYWGANLALCSALNLDLTLGVAMGEGGACMGYIVL